MCDKDNYIDSIMDSYDSTPDMDSYTDLTDVQGGQIRDCFKNESTKNYENDDHSRNWKFRAIMPSSMKLKLSK